MLALAATGQWLKYWILLLRTTCLAAMSPCVCVARSMKVPSGSVQCDGSVVAAWASLSLTTHKYQIPAARDTASHRHGRRNHSLHLLAPFSAHYFPAPCPVLPIFCRFQVWTSLKIFRSPSLRWASGAARDTAAGHIHYPHDVAASSCETRGDTRRHGPRGN